MLMQNYTGGYMCIGKLTRMDIQIRCESSPSKLPEAQNGQSEL